MKRDTIELILVIAGLIFGATMLCKLIIEIFKSSIHLWAWFLIFVNIAMTCLGIGLGIILFLLLIAGIVMSFKFLEEKLADYFSNLNLKISQILQGKPEKIFPVFIAAISQAAIFMLSGDFALVKDKAFLTVILSVIFSLVLITASRDNKRRWGVVAIASLIILVGCLMCAKYQIANFTSLKFFIVSQFAHLVSVKITTIDMLSVGLIGLSFIILTAISFYYGLRKSVPQTPV